MKPKIKNEKLSKSTKKPKKVRIKFLNNMKIRTKLIISFLIILIIPLTIVVWFFYESSLKAVEVKVKFITDELSTQANVTLDMRIKEIENISAQIFTNKFVYESLSTEYKGDEFNKYQKRRDVSSILNLQTSANGYIDFINIYLLEDDSIIYSGTSNQDTYLHSQFINEDIFKNHSKGINWVVGLNGDYDSLYLLRDINNINYNKPIGVMLIGTKISTFSDVIKDINLGEGSDFYIVDSDGTILINSDSQKLGQLEDAQIMEQIKANINQDSKGSSFTLNDNLISYRVCSNGWISIAKIPTNIFTAEVQNVGTLAVVISVICIVIATILSIIIANTLSNPLKRIMQLMRMAETGDLTVKSNEYNKSEIGQLSKSFDSMIFNMNNLVNNSLKIAKQVYNDTQVVNSVATQTSTIATQISLSISSISKGNSEQATSAVETNETMHSLTDHINKEEEILNLFSDTVESTKDIGSKATSVVGELNKRSEQTLSIFNTIHNNIVDLNENSKKIIKITKLIDDITEQTNLLSLNARIEAARAGDAGSGFKLVANEVNKLAVQSKDATNFIKQITNTIQKDTLTTVDVINKGTITFQNQLEAVKNTNTAFEEIDTSLEKVSTQIKELIDIMDSISDMQEDVTQAIESITSITEQTASATQEVMATGEDQAESAKKLSELANGLSLIVQTLEQKISHFKI